MQAAAVEGVACACRLRGRPCGYGLYRQLVAQGLDSIWCVRHR